MFNRFYRLETHSLIVGIFDPACELLPSWTKKLYLCTVAPLPSLWSPPLHPSQTKCTEPVFVDLLRNQVSILSLAGRYETLFVVLSRQATKAGEIDSSESMPGLHKRLQIRVQYMQTVCGWGESVGGGVLSCVVDHILQKLYTLFLNKFRTYKNDK